MHVACTQLRYLRVKRVAKEWIGELKAENLNLKLIWKIGLERAQTSLKKFDYSDRELDTSKFNSNVSMNCPFGQVY
jgi:hypothetical protein